MRHTAKTSALLLFACCLGLNQPAEGQDDRTNPEIDLDKFIEEVFSPQDDDLAYSDLYESLYQLYTSPLSINEASYDELAGLYILTPVQVQQIISYRNTNGPFLSQYELQAVPELDLTTIYRMLPFISIGSGKRSARTLWQRIASEKNNYLILRTEQDLRLGKQQSGTAGTESSGAPHLGGPAKQYARFRVSHPGDFSLGFTAEKDGGERLRWSPNESQFGADFYSFHIESKNRGRLKSLNLGDYQLQMGQGLVFGAGYGTGKGAETILTARRNSTGLRPYTSVLESGFFRGAAATYALKRLEVTALVSRLLQDGNLQSDSTQTQFPDFVSGILNTGFHRTAAELERKNKITEYNTGGTVLYKTAKLQIGINSLYSHYSTPIKKPDRLYNRFEFSGNSNLISSLFASAYLSNTQVFGEIARSSSGGTGAVGGLLLSVSKELGLSMVGRTYSPDFHSFYARAFGENSRNINEAGIYWGLKWTPFRKLELTAYYDHFSFPWLRYNADAPTQGHEYMAAFKYSISKATQVYGQYRLQQKAVNSEANEFNVRVPEDGIKTNFSINLNHQASARLHFKSRVQLSKYVFRGVATSGVALVQDVNLKWQRFAVSSRFSLFGADDYQNRQYVYERDVLYAVSIPAYAGRGVRSYLLFKFNTTPRTTLYFRWSKFVYFHKGDGSASEPSEIKIQLLARLY